MQVLWTSKLHRTAIRSNSLQHRLIARCFQKDNENQSWIVQSSPWHPWSRRFPGKTFTVHSWEMFLTGNATNAKHHCRFSSVNTTTTAKIENALVYNSVCACILDGLVDESLFWNSFSMPGCFHDWNSAHYRQPPCLLLECNMFHKKSLFNVGFSFCRWF